MPSNNIFPLRREPQMTAPNRRKIMVLYYSRIKGVVKSNLAVKVKVK